MIRLEPFDPSPIVEKATDPITREVWPPRRSTTDEQRQEAIGAALEAMLDAEDWTAEVEVRWTRGEPTVLRLTAHAEHLATERGTRPVAVLDALTEHTLDGRAVATTPSERFRRLESELEEAWDLGLESDG